MIEANASSTICSFTLARTGRLARTPRTDGIPMRIAAEIARLLRKPRLLCFSKAMMIVGIDMSWLAVPAVLIGKPKRKVRAGI